MSGVISRFDTYDGKTYFTFDPLYDSGLPYRIAVHNQLEKPLKLTPSMFRDIATAMEALEASGVEVTEFISNDHKFTLTKNGKREEDELGFPYSVTGIKRL